MYAGAKSGSIAGSLDELVEHQEELIRVDRSAVEVVVAVLAVVEVEPAELPNWIRRDTIISMFVVGAWCPRSTSEKAFGPSC